MKTTEEEPVPEKVLNTQSGNQPLEEAVNVTVLLSDYAKIRAIARDAETTPMETLSTTLCAGVRRLAAESASIAAKSAVFAVAWFLLSTASADAGIFSSKSEEPVRAVRERQIGQLGSAKAADYRTAMAARANLAEDCAALSRMIKEKENRYAEISGELERQYGMTLSQNYNYSKEDLTLYLVVTNGLFGSSPEKPVMRAHRAFLDETEAQGFVTMVASRGAVADDAVILRRFLAERQRDLGEKDKRLQEDYGVIPGKDYRFDEKTGKLFEIQPLPTEAELKAQREAEARAAADARASARLRAEAERREKAEKEAKAKAEKARSEAEAKARREAEAKARKEAELKARKEKEAAEARAKAEKEAREKAEKARKEAEAKARKEAELKARKEKEAAEARAKAEKKAAEARERVAAEARKKAAKARREAERNAKKEYGW